MIFIDAHVHFYDSFDLIEAFGHAFSNFNSISAQISAGNNYECIIFLTETEGNKYFDIISHLASENTLNDNEFLTKFKITFTEETNSLVITELDFGKKIYVVAGKQIVTKENLEVLALGQYEPVKSGDSINDTIKVVIENGSIPVVPWGVGKWLGKRGKIVENLIKQRKFISLFLGDNSNRPFFWPKSKLFSFAEKAGINNLQGSDPLPFNGEAFRIGSFGSFIDASMDDLNFPFKSIKKILLDVNININEYGKLEKLIKSIKNQLNMQLVKHSK